MYFKGWKNCLFGLILGFCCSAKAEIRVAILDTGYSGEDVKLCTSGHYDVVNNKPGIPKDIWSGNHGTNVARIINQYAVSDYCAIIINVYDRHDGSNAQKTIAGIKKAIEAKADVINISMNSNFEYSINEWYAFKDAENHNIKIFLASGNDGKNLNKVCDVYPVCYKKLNFIVVSNTSRSANKASFITNFQDYCVGSFCGTSASTPIATGKYIRYINFRTHNKYMYKVK